jgi:hypothetical protein
VRRDEDLPILEEVRLGLLRDYERLDQRTQRRRRFGGGAVAAATVIALFAVLALPLGQEMSRTGGRALLTGEAGEQRWRLLASESSDRVCLNIVVETPRAEQRTAECDEPVVPGEFSVREVAIGDTRYIFGAAPAVGSPAVALTTRQGDSRAVPTSLVRADALDSPTLPSDFRVFLAAVSDPSVRFRSVRLLTDGDVPDVILRAPQWRVPDPPSRGGP